MKLLPLLGMLYATLSLASLVLAYQVINLHGWVMTGAALVIPLRYFMGDILAEVYGFYLAKRMMWYLFICSYIFALLVLGVIHLPSPPYWQHQEAFELVLGHLVRVTTFAFIAILIGSNLNIYLVSKWKNLLKGRVFFLRSLAASGIGEVAQYSIGLPFVYFSFLPAMQIFHLVVADVTVQIIFLAVISLPASFVMSWIRYVENMNVYENDLRFNPFVLSEPVSTDSK